MPLQVDPEKFQSLKKQNELYILLVAESSDVFEAKKMAHILLSTRKGYIFIQTDKTIYNPGEHGEKSELFINK